MSLDPPISATCIGQLLIAAGLLDDAPLDAALDRQRIRNVKLGDLLVEMGVLDPADLNAVLTLQDDLRGSHSAELAGLIGGRLGMILLGSAAITRAQLEHAIHEQERSRILLGEVLRAQGAISREQLEAALGDQRTQPQLRPERYKLGRMLVDDGVLSEHQLDAALEAQSARNERLGAILVEAGVLEPSRLLDSLARQRHIISAAIAGSSAAANDLAADPGES